MRVICPEDRLYDGWRGEFRYLDTSEREGSTCCVT